MDEKSLWNLFEPSFYKESNYLVNEEDAHDAIVNNFTRIFGLTIYAINPQNKEDKQVKTYKELSELFPFYLIPAERALGEDGTQNNNSLGRLISSFF